MNNWWQNIVIYQIYPKSFKDSNGDGIGDIPGIIEKLDYLEELGIEAIWLSPLFKSPQADNGYDVSDYEDIDPLFGTLEDMEELIKEADKRGIKILLDLVLNHSSDEHPWFLEALKGEDNPYHDFYIWRDGKEGELPSDLVSAFSGPAWTYVPSLGKYYFHHFHRKQPDLNWQNPRVREEIYAMINRWIDKGIGGFRLDVIDMLAKDIDEKAIIKYPEIHEIIQELSKNCFQGKNIVTVGETWSANVEEAKKWSNPDGSELSMVFQFEHITLDQVPGQSKYDLASFELIYLKEIFEKWQTQLRGQGWNSLFLENHDLPRIVSRWGDDQEHHVQSAKMFATLIHGMQGTPYIYEGQEIGMSNPHWRALSKYRDVEALNLFDERIEAGYSSEDIMDSLDAKGRDNARTPMQWTSGKNAGFTDGTPWIDLNDNYTEINVEAQINDPNSIFTHYKNLVHLRKEYDIIAEGEFELLLKDDEEVFAYKRNRGAEELVIVCNFYENTISRDIAGLLNGHELLLESYSAEGIEDINTLRPYESRIYYKKA